MDVTWSENAKACHLCTTEFSTFRRRHHCRACGETFCRRCLPEEHLLPRHLSTPKMEKVCLGCKNRLTDAEAKTTRSDAAQEPCERIRGFGASLNADGLPKGNGFKVLSWNIQFCAGRSHLFFYEGGDAVQVPITDIQTTMKVVADIIVDHDPDIVLLQEVDRYSKRSHYQDELLEILRHLDDAGQSYPYAVSTPYHRCKFVPAPLSQPMGRVEFHLACLSKFPIEAAVRHQMPLLQESKLRQYFNLKRAIMEVHIPVQGGGDFVAMNTHLSAFAFNDGTPEKEIAMLDAHATQLENQKTPWMLTGDFNMLPPQDRPERLGVINNMDHSEYYNKEASPITPLTNKYRSAMDLEAYVQDPAPSNTYLPLGTDVADRVLDWSFVGSALQMSKYSVLSNHRHVSVASDHLPTLLELQID